MHHSVYYGTGHVSDSVQDLEYDEDGRMSSWGWHGVVGADLSYVGSCDAVDFQRAQPDPLVDAGGLCIQSPKHVLDGCFWTRSP